MPSQNKQQTQDVDLDKVSVIINGKVHSDWSQYQIDSDFLIPADAWSLRLGLPTGVFPTDVTRGAPVQVKVGGDTVMTGRVDRVQRNVSRDQVTLSLSGRDGAAILVDCAAPIFTSRQVTLNEVITQVVRPLGVSKIRLNAESSLRNDKISMEPGERAWDTLLRAAAARGLWPWFEPNGTLVIGGPDYSAPPVATLILRRDGKGNNVLSLTDESSIERSFSVLTILAQGHAHTTKQQSLTIIEPNAEESVSTQSETLDDDGSDDSIEMDTGTAETGQHGLKYAVSDPSVTYYRPDIRVVHDVDDLAQVQYRARKVMADGRLAGYSLTAIVKGHRTSDNVLWQPGQRIHVISEPHGLDAIYFLMGRTLGGGRPGGKTTTLRLKENGIWIPDAFPRQKNKRHKKKKQELQIINVG